MQEPNLRKEHCPSFVSIEIYFHTPHFSDEKHIHSQFFLASLQNLSDSATSLQRHEQNVGCVSLGVKLAVLIIAGRELH